MLVDSREAGIEDVYKFCAEVPPPDPRKKKKAKGLVSDEPPPHRNWNVIKHYPKGRQSDTQAKMDQEKLEQQFKKEDQAAAWKHKKR